MSRGNIKTLLPYKPEHKKVVEDLFAVSKVSCTCLCPTEVVHGLFSGLTMEPMMFSCYPCVEYHAHQLGMRPSQGSVIAGATHPKYVFTVIKRAFELCYPAEDPAKHIEWELWVFNLSYYGQEAANKSPSWQSHMIKMSTCKSVGGPMQTLETNWGTELTYRRAAYAMPVIDFFKDDGFGKKFCPETVPVEKLQLAERRKKTGEGIDVDLTERLFEADYAIEKMQIE